MNKHINFFGYTFWVSDDGKHSSYIAAPSSRHFYSPSILGAYCIFSSFSVGIFLYSINLSRRGYVWQGRLLAILSASFFVFLVFQGLFFGEFLESSLSLLLNTLVAINLYGVEKSHFDRAMRNGGKPARWWIPLIWIGLVVVIQFLLSSVL